MFLARLEGGSCIANTATTDNAVQKQYLNVYIEVLVMIGAIAGDIIGSRFEAQPIKRSDFDFFHPHCRFTDDTVLTVAVADAILRGLGYAESLQIWARKYPNAGYGGTFYRWIWQNDPQPYNSWGNGSAMRVSAVGFAFDAAEQVLAQAERSAAVSHNHPEGIKGAQAVALAIFLARSGHSKTRIRSTLKQRFGHDLDRTLAQIRPRYTFDVSCQGSVPEAIIAFLESTDLLSAIGNAVSLGGDSDTQACIAGSIAEAFYGGVPDALRTFVRDKMPDDMWRVVTDFYRRYLPRACL
jgi:ADP-ribosylglycohydrolase